MSNSPLTDLFRAGPGQKQGYLGLMRNACMGVVCHSMVGPYSAALGELDNLARRASWQYSVLKSGIIVAHYHDEAVAWHAGGMVANGRLIGIEHEGGLSPYDEPLTPAQESASIALVQELSRRHGFPLIRGIGLFEHNEVSIEGTACPSGRIPWPKYSGGIDMATIEELRLAIGAIAVAQAKDIKELQNTQKFTGRIMALLSTGQEAQAERELRYVYHIGGVPWPA